MDELMVNYQAQLEQLGWQGLDVRPATHPRSKAPGDLLGTFVGSQKCSECHQAEFDVWAATPHAHATETLTGLDPPRQYDPECISCHSTGWHPQEYFPYQTGFDSLDATPLLTGNGCENCHGPGAAHVDAEEADDSAMRDAMRRLMQVSLDQARSLQGCAQCHDLDNSPDYDFDEYWPHVQH
jgi:hypothetical protein